MTTTQPALIIIDMQQGMSSPAAGPRNNLAAEDNMLTLLAAWRKAGAPVVHVRHISSTPGSPFWPGQSGVEFQPRFKPAAGEHTVEKNVPDAFINTGLEHWLHNRQIHRIVIIGVSTNISVESAARTAGNLGFGTYVAEDATFTFDRTDCSGTHRTAQEVHAMSLANLQGEFATVSTTSGLLKMLQT